MMKASKKVAPQVHTDRLSERRAVAQFSAEDIVSMSPLANGRVVVVVSVALLPSSSSSEESAATAQPPPVVYCRSSVN